jgi:hypothetical protein
VSGTTQVALLVAGIGLIGTVIAAPFVNAWLQRRNAQRASHAPAAGAARLIQREMEQAYVTAQDASERGEDEVPLPSEEWDQHKAAVASRITSDELLVLDRYYALVKLGAVPGVLAVHSMAMQAIAWLAKGDVNVTKPRKTEASLAPLNMDLPCKCGHIFGHDGWRAMPRRIRLTRRHAKFKDVGFECKRCDCEKFRGVGRLIYL